jgi:hypothetical protein
LLLRNLFIKSLRDRSVWGLKFDDGRADRVIKLDINRPTSLMREKQVMQILKVEGFAVPEIEFTQEDLPSVWIPFKKFSQSYTQ